MPWARPESGETSSGQQNATRPATDTSATAASDRGRRVGARVAPASRRHPGEALAHVVDGQPRARRESPWTPGGRRRATTPHLGGRPVGHDLAVRHDDDPVRHSATNSTSCVDTTTDRPRRASPRSTRPGRPWPSGRGHGSARRAGAPAGRRSAARRARGRASAPRTGRAGAARSGCRVPPPRAAARRCRSARRSRGRPARTPRRRCRGRAGPRRSAAPCRPANGALPHPGCAARPRRMPCRGCRCRPAASCQHGARGEDPLPCSAHSSEDLPQPLRPMSAVTSPGCRSRSTSLTASTSPG